MLIFFISNVCSCVYLGSPPFESDEWNDMTPTVRNEWNLNSFGACARFLDPNEGAHLNKSDGTGIGKRIVSFGFFASYLYFIFLINAAKFGPVPAAWRKTQSRQIIKIMSLGRHFALGLIMFRTNGQLSAICLNVSTIRLSTTVDRECHFVDYSTSSVLDPYRMCFRCTRGKNSRPRWIVRPFWSRVVGVECHPPDDEVERAHGLLFPRTNHFLIRY